MFEVILDTETTGLSVKEGHRIVEIGCIELIDQIPTGKKFHYYINPERKNNRWKKKCAEMTNEAMFKVLILL